MTIGRAARRTGALSPVFPVDAAVRAGDVEVSTYMPLVGNETCLREWPCSAPYPS